MKERKHSGIAPAGRTGSGDGSHVPLRQADGAATGSIGREVVRILLLEDRDADAELVERSLRKAGFAYTFERAKDEIDFLARLDPPPHVIISDYYVPGCDALHALRVVRSRGLDIPFILVSGVIGEARALEAMRLGATDFVLKDRLGRLGSAIRTALELAALRRNASGNRQKLERSESEFREAFDNAAIGMALTTLDGRWLKVNRAFSGITGYSMEELQHRDCYSVMHPDEVAEDAEALGSLLAGKIDVSQREQRYVHREGHAVWAQVTSSLVRDGAGKPLYRVLQVIDIAERRKTESRLALANRARKVMAEGGRALVRAADERQLLQEMCRMVVEAGGYVQAYIGLAQADEEGTVLPVASAGFEEGYLEQAQRSWKSTESRPSVMADVIASGLRFISRDIFTDSKLQRWAERARSRGYQSLICLPFKIDERCIGAISIYAREPDAFDNDEIELLEALARDISYGVASLRARAALRESEEHFRATFEQAAVGVAHTTTDGRFLQANNKLCEILGYTRAELAAVTTRDLTYPEDRDRQDALRRELIEGRRTSFAAEKRYVRKDGSVIWGNRTVTLACPATGEPYLIQVIQDISERKQAEQAAREREERYRAMFDNAAVGITRVDLGGLLVDVNQKFCDLLGYTRDELCGKAVRDVTHPDDFGQGEGMRTQLSRGGAGSVSGEKRFVRKDGTVIWARRTMSTVLDGAGKPQYLISVVEDISERKRAEEAVAGERALLRTIIDTVPDYIYVKDAQGRFQLANKAWLSERNSDPEEIVGKTVFDVFSPPELARKMAEQDAAIVSGGPPLFEQEQRVTVKTPDGNQGRTGWTSITKVPMREPSGRIIGTVGISRDITEQKVSARRREMEHAITRTLSESGPLDKAIRRILQTVCEGLEWACGAHWQWDEAGGVLRCVDTWHVDADKVAQFAAASRDRIIEGRGWRAGFPSGTSSGGLVRGVWESGAPVWVPDFAQRPDFRRGPAAAKAGLQCAFAFPILAEEKPLGVMEFYGSDIKEPDEALLQMVRAIGSQIGQFIQRKEAEQALGRNEERYRDQFEASPLPMWVWDDAALRFLAVNEAAIEHYGYTREEFLRMSVRDIWAPGEEARYDENLRLRAAERTLNLRRKHRTKDGRTIDVEVTARRFVTGGRTVWLTLVNDISVRLRAEMALHQSEEQFRQLANNIPQVFWITDVRQKETLYLSPAAEELIGQPLQEIRDHPRILVTSVHHEDRSRVYAARKTATAGGYDETYRIVRPDGTIRWVHDRAFPVRDGSGQVYRIAGIAEDITERKLAEERLMHLAHYDVLTSLPNRVLYYDRLKQALAQAKRNQWTVGVMLIDVDRFKNVNDTLGHAVGDQLLQQVSERLTSSVRAGDTVGRLGGDEFAVALFNLTTAQDANLVAQKIMASFKDPFRLEGGSEIYVTASIGITLYPDDSTDQDTLIKNADAAMYSAKAIGRNAYRFYTPEMNARALELLSMESKLRGALDRGEYLLYYQPKVSLTGGEVVGLESLIRWRHPERGLVSPGEFMPVLEETGLIVAVGEWVVRAVCAQITQWRRAGIDPKSVAINLSARQFVDKDLGTTIEGILEENGIDPSLMEFEITESSLMTNAEESIRTMELLTRLGIGLSIDDFGTGYSSLGYLKRFPLDALKIDRSFVRDITTNADDATITRAVISMAHSLGLKVIAEGVETKAQLEFLAEHGCDECQGYYFSPPLPAEECGVWLKENSVRARPAQPPQPEAPVVLLVEDDSAR